MKNDDHDETYIVGENPYPANEPLGIIWAFFNEADPTPQQLKRFPCLLLPENDHLLWTLFDRMVVARPGDRTTVDDREQLSRFYIRNPHIYEQQMESRKRTDDFFHFLKH